MVAGYVDPGPSLARFRDRVQQHAFTDFVSLQRLIASVEFNLVPLQYNTFTNCKSELKYFEAAIVGTQTIASPTYSYARAIRHGENGYLAQAHQWTECVRRAVAAMDEDYRSMANESYEDARAKFAWFNQAYRVLAAVGMSSSALATANRGNLGLGRRAKTAARAGICVALVVLGITTAVFLHLPRHMVVDTGPHAVTLGPITSRASFVQELDLKGPLRISSVEVLLATWGRPTNTTHDAVRVFAADGTLLRTLALPPGSLKDNTYARVDLGTPLAIGNTGKLFVQVSSSDGSVHDSITAWATLATVSDTSIPFPARHRRRFR